MYWRTIALLILLGGVVTSATLYPRPADEGTIKQQTDDHNPAANRVTLPVRIGQFIEAHNGAISALSTIIIAVFTVTLWWTTQGTLNHLRREFEAEHRPWIPADIQLASGWTWNSDGEGRVTLRFTLRNIGRSPATNVDVRIQMFPLGWGFPDPASAQRAISQQERTGPIKPGEGMGLTIFPSSAPRDMHYNIGLSAADIDTSHRAFAAVFPEVNPTTVTPVIVGCITYRFHGEKHQTGFILEVSRIDPSAPNASFVLDPAHGNVPMERLRIRDSYVGSAIID